MEKRWSLSVPMEGFALPELADVAREAERLGYTDSWSFEVDGVDGFTPLAVIGLSTSMRIGTAIANVYTRGPASSGRAKPSIGTDRDQRFSIRRLSSLAVAARGSVPGFTSLLIPADPRCRGSTATRCPRCSDRCRTGGTGRSRRAARSVP